jgi:hypothetical protein
MGQPNRLNLLLVLDEFIVQDSQTRLKWRILFFSARHDLSENDKIAFFWLKQIFRITAASKFPRARQPIVWRVELRFSKHYSIIFNRENSVERNALRKPVQRKGVFILDKETAIVRTLFQCLAVATNQPKSIHNWRMSMFNREKKY